MKRPAGPIPGSRWGLALWLQNWHLHAARVHLQQTLRGLDRRDLPGNLSGLQFHLDGATHHLQVMLGNPFVVKSARDPWSLVLLHFHQEHLRSTAHQVLEMLGTQPGDGQLQEAWNRLMHTRDLLLHQSPESRPPHG